MTPTSAPEAPPNDHEALPSLNRSVGTKTHLLTFLLLAVFSSVVVVSSASQRHPISIVDEITHADYREGTDPANRPRSPATVGD